MTGFFDCDFERRDWTKSLLALEFDGIGFFALVCSRLTYFEKQGYGQ
jgi:hypothetical protein